jgi:hypothetical protein
LSNPYSPPKAPVADVLAPPLLPRRVRALRGFALAGNVLLALIAVGIVLSGQRGAPIFVFAASVVLLSCTSIAALAPA